LSETIRVKYAAVQIMMSMESMVLINLEREWRVGSSLPPDEAHQVKARRTASERAECRSRGPRTVCHPKSLRVDRGPYPRSIILRVKADWDPFPRIDRNRRCLVQKSNAKCLQNGVRGRESGAPGAIPTRDLPLRRRTLYATELREHNAGEW
jgi:hypothetical protein